MTTEGRSEHDEGMAAAPPQGSRAKQCRVFLVDPVPLFLEGMRIFLERLREFVVIGEASSARSALDQISLPLPDLILLDISSNPYEAAIAAEQVKRQWPAIKVIALAEFADKDALGKMMEASASGYVLKSSSPDELLKAIRHALQGGTYLDSNLDDDLVEVVYDPSARSDFGLLPPTKRELLILKLSAQGYYSRDIAAKLGISAKTVDTLKARAMHKLGLQSRVELIRYALGRGWLEEA